MRTLTVSRREVLGDISKMMQSINIKGIDKDAKLKLMHFQRAVNMIVKDTYENMENIYRDMPNAKEHDEKMLEYSMAVQAGKAEDYTEEMIKELKDNDNKIQEDYHKLCERLYNERITISFNGITTDEYKSITEVNDFDSLNVMTLIYESLVEETEVYEEDAPLEEVENNETTESVEE